MKVLFIFKILNLFILINGREQNYQPARYGIAGESISLPCSPVDSAQYLRWRFNKNGTASTVDAGQIYPGGLPKVFGSFDVPEGRSEIIVTTSFFQINYLKLEDEGDYWCEISSAQAETLFSDKLPVHIWMRPTEPIVTGLGSNVINEYAEKYAARCSSKGGKPASTLTWMNGSTPIYAPDVEPVTVKNSFNSLLNDTSLDLKLARPTRFDHNRVFHCKIEHPAYKEPMFLNYTIQVKYHPVNIKMWANVTKNEVYCKAEGFPEPQYAWTLPGNILSGDKSTDVVYIANLAEMPGGAFFYCEAYNEMQPNATIRMSVDELIYPDGRPGLLGLDWWIWGAILGGVVVFIAIIIIIICCRRRSKKARGGGTLQTKYTAANKKPIVITSSHDQEYTTRDREDSFDDDISPAPGTNQRHFMGEDTFIKDVTLVPSNNVRASRENLNYNSNRSNSRDNLYSHNRANSRENLVRSRENLHASREQLNEAADHIATLNKSWDYLSRSREELNNVQSELQHTRDSHIHGSQENLDARDSIPFVDHEDDRYYDDRYNTGNYNTNEYPEKVPLDDRQDYDQQDERYKTYNAPPRYTENSGYNDQYNQHYDDNNQPYDDDNQQYDDRSYNRNQEYSQDGYYDDQYHDQQQGYDDRYGDRNQKGNNYNYHPARIV